MMNAMAVQYKAKARRKTGGGASGSGFANKDAMGPIKTRLIGYMIVDTVTFHAIGDSLPGNHSPFLGKSPISDPKRELERN